MYVRRHLEEAFKEAGRFFPALLVTGARQVGKTTFLRKIAEAERRFVSLDAPDVRQLARSDPRLFLSQYPPPVIIDEIQYAPELLPYIKVAIDEARFNDKKKAGGLFWLTGSQQFQMMKGITESLAGRIGIFELHGLSNRELSNTVNRPFRPDTFQADTPGETSTAAFFERVWMGSFPELATSSAARWSDCYGSYVQTYLARDVRDLTQVADLNRFYAFIKAVAARTGQMLNYASLARDADISQPTAKQYVSVLEASGLVFRLYPYLRNHNRQMIRTPKIYMFDSGLAAYLTEWTTPAVMASGAMAGQFFETWCVSEILKSYANAGLQPHVYYYRDKDQREIDLIIEQDGTLYPVEIKKGATFRPDDTKSFVALKQFNKPVGMGALVSLHPELLQIRQDCMAIPSVQL